MKNSIMKKTWGILLGFGVLLATAAFVLTGCVIEEADEATLTVNNGTSETDATIRLVLDGGTWNNPLLPNSASLGSAFTSTMSFAFDPSASGKVSGTSGFTAVRVSDSEVDVTFPLLSSTASTYEGKVKISNFYESTLKSYTNLYGTSTTVVADLTTEVPIKVTAASNTPPDATVALSDGTVGDNKVRLTLTGAKWNDPLASTILSSTTFDYTLGFSFDPSTYAVTGTTGYTAERVSDTVVDVAFWLTASTTTTSYTGKVKVSNVYESSLRGFTDLTSSKTVEVDQTTEVNIVVTSKAPSGGGGGGTTTEETTAADLVTSLNALLSSTATAAQKVSASGSTVTLGDSNIAIPSGTTITVPSTVTLVVRDSGAKTLTVNGILQVKGTVETKGGGLVLGSGGIISGTGTIKHLSGSTTHLLNINSSGTYTIGAVTFQGLSTGIGYGLVNIEGSAGTVNFTGTKFTGHKRTSASGGGLSVGAGTVTLSNCEVSGNEVSASNGGGISISGGTVTLTGGTTVQGNTASGNGGGVWVSGGTLQVGESTIYGSKKTGGSTETLALQNAAGTNSDALGFLSPGVVKAINASGGWDTISTDATTFDQSVSGTNNATNTTLSVDASGNYSSKAAR